MIASYYKHELHFKKPARTSRGEMVSHTIYYIQLQRGARKAWGEAAPLKGLSIDDVPEFETKLKFYCDLLNEGLPFDALALDEFPSLQFAFETAQLGLKFDDPFKLFENPFYQGQPVSINGLVWMNTKNEMLEEAFTKAEEGFTCIKFKVGALDFDEECRMLESFRKRYHSFKIDIRLDANGAFAPTDAREKLRELSRFEIHSIEQPIKQGQEEWMEALCKERIIDIALDEELIGINSNDQRIRLLNSIRPQYIILKPTLIGGFNNADEWIRIAQQKDVGWWATSALESNIGLNAIAQWFAANPYKSNIPQGLGTGSLYLNNIESPLYIKNGELFYSKQKNWRIPFS
ncbi:MAG: o-succinylbenzoate synthase [Bacteroidia bacterium]|jgi:o-succinylbenzoate synthase|nr:o-succinylbenzoate synthase [Bacteroidia bacterium]